MPKPAEDHYRDPDASTTHGELDRDLLARIGRTIRARRVERSLTVQQLADRSRISRRLLTQIEHGQANPSLVVVTRIARQLGTEFTELLRASDDASPIEVHPDGTQVLVWSSDRGSTAHLLASTADVRSADLWLWRLAPDDTYRGHADPARSQELFVVLEGTLTLCADDAEHDVPAGASAKLRSDRPYAYVNHGDATAVFIRTAALAT
jgi:transcriptional regulator with XRE-family HTH domain